MSIEKAKLSRVIRREEVVELKCELCGKKAPRPKHHNWVGPEHPAQSAWTNVQLIRADEEEGIETGSKTVLDVCPECFENKLLVWAFAQGATVRKEEF